MPSFFFRQRFRVHGLPAPPPSAEHSRKNTHQIPFSRLPLTNTQVSLLGREMHFLSRILRARPVECKSSLIDSSAAVLRVWSAWWPTFGGSAVEKHDKVEAPTHIGLLARPISIIYLSPPQRFDLRFVLDTLLVLVNCLRPTTLC